jgi:peptide/nickel transport system substrate-binding protein
MNDSSHKRFDNLVGPGESLRVMDSLRRGASRRDVLAMLMAGGMQATLAGSIAGLAANANAQTPTPRKGGRIKVAGAVSSVSDTLDPAKQANQADYARGFTFYNGLTWLDSSLTPQPEPQLVLISDRGASMAVPARSM